MKEKKYFFQDGSRTPFACVKVLSANRYTMGLICWRAWHISSHIVTWIYASIIDGSLKRTANLQQSMNIHECKCREACNSVIVDMFCPPTHQPSCVVVSTQDFQVSNWGSIPGKFEIFLILDFLFQYQTLLYSKSKTEKVLRNW